MSNMRRHRRSAARANNIPVSPKEKLRVLVHGLAGMVNAIEQNKDQMTTENCAMMAEHLLGIVGFRLSKRVETPKEEKTDVQDNSTKA